MSNIQTLPQVIEEVKERDWGHEYRIHSNYTGRLHCQCGTDPTHVLTEEPCPVKIARAQQAAVAKAYRHAAWLTMKTNVGEGQNWLSDAFTKAADAIEKELEG